MNTADFVSLMNSYVFNIQRLFDSIEYRDKRKVHLDELRTDYLKALDKVLNPGANALARSGSEHEVSLARVMSIMEANKPTQQYCPNCESIQVHHQSCVTCEEMGKPEPKHFDSIAGTCDKGHADAMVVSCCACDAENDQRLCDRELERVLSFILSNRSLDLIALTTRLENKEHRK